MTTRLSCPGASYPRPSPNSSRLTRITPPSQPCRSLTAYDACTAPGEIGALLRREGIYSSHLSTWRKQRSEAELAGLVPKKRGRKADPAIAEARRLDQLTRENVRLRHQLAQARTIIDVQKKVSMLLAQLTTGTPDGTS